MRYDYGGRFAEISIRRGGVVKGFYVVAVDVDEVDADGNDVIGINFSVPKSFCLEGVRKRAETNSTSTVVEVDIEISAMQENAKRRFRDAVDMEALGG